MSLISGWQIVTIITIRILCLGLVRSYDFPDEYWQGPEIAYKMAYGYGYQTWQWTMDQPIRSPIYAFYLSLGYRFLNLLNITNDFTLDYVPWILNCIIAIFGDIFFIKTIRFYFQQISFKTILFVLTNWYYLGTMTRTFYNSFQTSLTLIGFYYWLQRDNGKYNDKISRAVVSVCYWVRPTSLIVWTIVWPYELLLRIRLQKTPIKFIFKNLLTIIIMLAGSIIISKLYYGKYLLTEFNFVKYNIIFKWSELFGRNNFGDYFYKFLPFVMHIGIGFLLYGVYLLFCKKKDQSLIKMDLLKQLALLMLIMLLISSFSTHKQVRFLLIFLPFLLIISILGIDSLKATKKGKFLIFLTILLNAFLFLSLHTFGKTGGIQAMRYLRQDIDKKGIKNVKLIQLGEQHFIPLYSILHRNVTVQLLDSSGVAMAQNRNEYLLLINNPELLYNKLVQRLGAEPNYLIAHGLYYNLTESVILKHNFKKIAQFKNCHIFEQKYNNFCDTVIIFDKEETKNK